MSVKIRNLSKRFGDLEVFSDLSMEFPDHAITAILGPSGCGKTTLLNILSGVMDPDSGSVEGVAENTGYLFQEPRLLPWRTVFENIDLVLRRLYGKDEREQRIAWALGMVNLSAFKDYYPDELSGGMLQRAAIARAFAFPGDMLFMDEPFQALDMNLKLSLIRAFECLWQEEQKLCVLVTHNIHEALLLGDRIIIFTERPAKTRRIVENHVPHRVRSLRHPEILDLEKELYDTLLDSADQYE